MLLERGKSTERYKLRLFSLAGSIGTASSLLLLYALV